MYQIFVFIPWNLCFTQYFFSFLLFVYFLFHSFPSVVTVTVALILADIWILLICLCLLDSLCYLQHCHKHEALRDEVYCQLMKQTTNNKSMKPDSCQRGWRLFSIVAAYFVCSDTLKPYLFKYLETAAYDKRRAYHGKNLLSYNDLCTWDCCILVITLDIYF
jgi:hypothetical protein